MRGGEGHPGTREGSLLGWHGLVASREGLKTCWRVIRVLGKSLDRSGLHSEGSAGSSWTRRNQVACLTTVAAQAISSTALTFLKGERASGTAGGIQIHGDMLGGGRGWLGETSGRGWFGLAGRKGKAWLLLIPGEGCCSLVLLDCNSCAHVLRKAHRYGTPGRNFKPDVLRQFLRKKKDEGVVTPAWVEGLCYGLIGNG